MVLWTPTRLSRTYSQKDVLFIIEDWNAKVGSQETPGVTGKFSLGIRNEVGQRLIDSCQENALIIANTLFQQHKTRLYTWTSPDVHGQYQNQIDYILCSQRWRSSIHSAKTRPGADCGSDHELLIAKFRLKLKKVGETTRPSSYDLNQIPYDYIVEVRKISGTDLIDRVPNELWTEVLDTVQETGIQTTLKKKKCRKAKWLSEEALQIAVNRRESESEVAQSCPTLWDPMDCSLSGSSIHGIFQARLEWIAISFPRGSSRPRNRSQVSLIAGRRFTIWATREAPWKAG